MGELQFGIDVSEHQDGLSLVQAAAEGVEFVVVRTTDGTYRDSTYTSHVQDALRAGLAVEAYHYLRNPSEGTTVAEQVEAACAVMGDLVLPVWIDCETPAGLTVEHVRDARDRFLARGVLVAGIYTYPRYWRWQMLGADTAEFGAVWLADFGADDVGSPGELLRGRQWPRDVGKQTPLMWQYGSRGTVAGYEADVNVRRLINR
ncbi:GH25 family lysozyme [Corynebacterium sp. P3-F1]|uniref:glycoside hydrolase family 25 protein n=1 Tax=Corynebacterium sp. P3-F1 TaxID=3059080 RepID=UPI00265CE99B|nr:GH25 family lysozyme [Corynebacterium sp. P3-F1]WKK61896.1 GH25 family lysozyme [Corynebacterium sp. P3-F1]